MCKNEKKNSRNPSLTHNCVWFAPSKLPLKVIINAFSTTVLLFSSWFLCIGGVFVFVRMFILFLFFLLSFFQCLTAYHILSFHQQKEGKSLKGKVQQHHCVKYHLCVLCNSCDAKTAIEQKKKISCVLFIERHCITDTPLW